MLLTPAKVRRKLVKISFSTAHASVCKGNVITHLLTYERSVASGDEINLSALFAACNYLAWLSDHVRLIDDKQVLPSQRLFLAEAYNCCHQLLITQSTI